MANYYGTTLSNWFRVKDEDAFRKIFARIVSSDEPITLWERTDEKGTKIFSFGGYTSICGIEPEQTPRNDEESDPCDADYDEMVKELSSVVADDDAIILTEIGNEKLCYLVGAATIITAKDVELLNLGDLSCDVADKLLGVKR